MTVSPTAGWHCLELHVLERRHACPSPHTTLVSSDRSAVTGCLSIAASHCWSREITQCIALQRFSMGGLGGMPTASWSLTSFIMIHTKNPKYYLNRFTVKFTADSGHSWREQTTKSRGRTSDPIPAGILPHSSGFPMGPPESC